MLLKNAYYGNVQIYVMPPLYDLQFPYSVAYLPVDGCFNQSHFVLRKSAAITHVTVFFLVNVFHLCGVNT